MFEFLFLLQLSTTDSVLFFKGLNRNPSMHVSESKAVNNIDISSEVIVALNLSGKIYFDKLLHLSKIDPIPA